MALLIYVSTNYVETVKQLDINRYVKLSLWSRGNASECNATGPARDRCPALARIFILGFCFVDVVFYLFVQHYLSRRFAMPFAMLI